jgi:hypothetical protein
MRLLFSNKDALAVLRKGKNNLFAQHTHAHGNIFGACMSGIKKWPAFAAWSHGATWLRHEIYHNSAGLLAWPQTHCVGFLWRTQVWGKTGSKLYGPSTGADYVDNHKRFALFCKAAIESVKVLPFGTGEEAVFVANDWWVLFLQRCATHAIWKPMWAT